MDEGDSVRVEEYLDFRALLRDLLASRRGDARHSLRAVARRAGLRSTNYLTLVLKGERTPSEETAEKLAQALGLRKREADYLVLLVALAREKRPSGREELHARLSRLRNRGAVRELDVAHSDYHSRWYIPAIRELVERRDFQEDARWIARAVRPSITAGQAKHALQTLESLGLVRRDETGRLRQADPLLSTRSGPLGHHIVSFHRAMLDRAAHALEEVPRQERDISALTLGVSEAVWAKLKARLGEFQRELLHLAQQSEEVERVVQVNFQLFPLSHVPSRRKDGDR